MNSFKQYFKIKKEAKASPFFLYKYDLQRPS